MTKQEKETLLEVVNSTIKRYNNYCDKVKETKGNPVEAQATVSIFVGLVALMEAFNIDFTVDNITGKISLNDKNK